LHDDRDFSPQACDLQIAHVDIVEQNAPVPHIIEAGDQ
jgi:hypothetical protein